MKKNDTIAPMSLYKDIMLVYQRLSASILLLFDHGSDCIWRKLKFQSDTTTSNSNSLRSKRWFQYTAGSSDASVSHTRALDRAIVLYSHWYHQVIVLKIYAIAMRFYLWDCLKSSFISSHELSRYAKLFCILHAVWVLSSDSLTLMLHY